MRTLPPRWVYFEIGRLDCCRPAETFLRSPAAGLCAMSRLQRSTELRRPYPAPLSPSSSKPILSQDAWTDKVSRWSVTAWPSCPPHSPRRARRAAARNDQSAVPSGSADAPHRWGDASVRALARAYPLNFRNIEERMAKRGVFVDHFTLHRWSIKVLPVLAMVFHWRKRPVGYSWRICAGCPRRSPSTRAVRTQWRSRASTRTAARASRCASRNISTTSSSKTTVPANALPGRCSALKTFGRARISLPCIEVMHMILNGKLVAIKDQVRSAPNEFYSLTF